MKTLLLTLFVCCIASVGTTQKAKIKDDIAAIDGVDFLNWKKRSSSNEISISSINSEEEEISAMYLNYEDPRKVTDSNPHGTVRWIQIYFVTLDLKCEIASRSYKGLALLIYENDLYVDGLLNEANTRKFVNKYGMRFTENRPGNNVNININN